MELPKKNVLAFHKFISKYTFNFKIYVKVSNLRRLGTLFNTSISIDVVVVGLLGNGEGARRGLNV